MWAGRKNRHHCNTLNPKPMPIHPQWSDDYWPLIVQLYASKPAGVKPLFAPSVIDLSIRLHLPPKVVITQMQRLHDHTTPSLQRLWNKYMRNRRRLKRDLQRVEEMLCFGAGNMFYDGVEVVDVFADNFRPLATDTKLSRAMLVFILDLYFRLIPATMVKETPEVKELAEQFGVSAEEVVEVLAIYQTFDPILRRDAAPESPLSNACRATWQHYHNAEPTLLAHDISRIMRYFVWEEN